MIRARFFHRPDGTYTGFTVKGHAGRYVLGYLEDVPVILMDGRVHYYEGYTMEQVVTPDRVMAKLGAQTVILTNAVGSMRKDFEPGDLVCVLKDGIYLQVTGPTYETPAEAAAYASLGADTVGMSTACETIALRHKGVKVLDINCVTNYCPNVVTESTSHEEVAENADKAGDDMVKLVKRIVRKIGEKNSL